MISRGMPRGVATFFYSSGGFWCRTTLFLQSTPYPTCSVGRSPTRCRSCFSLPATPCWRSAGLSRKDVVPRSLTASARRRSRTLTIKTATCSLAHLKDLGQTAAQSRTEPVDYRPHVQMSQAPNASRLPSFWIFRRDRRHASTKPSRLGKGKICLPVP